MNGRRDLTPAGKELPMKFHVILIAMLACVPVSGASKAKSQPAPQPAMTGCIDEQDGQYVLLDEQMRKVVSLVSAGPDQEVFAKHVGHKVEVKGTAPRGGSGTFRVTVIRQLEGACGQAK
jgi:hypothetical protein